MAVLLFTTVGLVGCQRPVETPESQEVSRIISAMSQVETFRLAITLTDSQTVSVENGRSIDTWLWTGQAAVNLPQDSAYVSMNITDTTYPEVTPYRWEMYFVGAWRYYSQSSPRVFGMTNPWTRYGLLGMQPLFSNSAQVAPLVELLNTAKKVNVVASEVVDGLNCDVTDVSPTASAASDWVLSQDRGGSGPSMAGRRTGPEGPKETYEKAYAGGTARFWTDQASSRIIKVDVILHFVMRLGNAGGLERTPRDFHGELHFSEYGQSLSIVPPPEALDAPTY